MLAISRRSPLNENRQRDYHGSLSVSQFKERKLRGSIRTPPGSPFDQLRRGWTAYRFTSAMCTQHTLGDSFAPPRNPPGRVARQDDERLKLSRINFNCKQFIPRMLAQFLEFAFGVILSGHAGS